MRTHRRLAALSVCAALLAAATAVAVAQERRLPPLGGAEAGRRLALVVGNDAYPGMPLKNAVKDARAMGKTLKALGFGVTVVENATLRRFETEVEGFVSKGQAGDVSAFYFAGHGAEVDARNRGPTTWARSTACSRVTSWRR